MTNTAALHKLTYLHLILKVLLVCSLWDLIDQIVQRLRQGSSSRDSILVCENLTD